MSEPQVHPSKITKPIQLLGAWLVGLFTVNAAFLAAASRLPAGSWEASALVVAAILNVPIFLFSLFLLQTKFRPELHEDSFYSTYINQKTNQTISVSRDEQRFATVISRLERVENLFSSKDDPAATRQYANILSELAIGVNTNLPNRKDIIEKLRGAGAGVLSRFGGHEQPEKLVVSLSQALPRRTVAAVLNVARDLGFTSYNYYDSHMEEISEDVLFGSYGPGELTIE